MLRSHLFAVTLLVAAGVTCYAQVDDPLHGACISASCSDNGTVTPITQNPMPTFTFDIDPKTLTGDFLVDILIPNNASNAASLSFSIGETDGGATDTSTVSPVSATLKGDWTSGDLATFLGISGSPASPLGAYLGPVTSAGDTGATGFEVYQVDLGSTELQKSSSPTAPILTLSGSSLPIDSTITAFLQNGQSYVATAASGQLFEADAPPASPVPVPVPTPVPEPTALLLLGSVAVLGLTTTRRMLTKNSR